MQILQKQCKKSSRKVTPEDAERVLKESVEMIKLCRQPLGQHAYAYALAHCQVDHADPLRFFVTLDSRVIINPKIKTHWGGAVTSLEGCMSYAFRPSRKVSRYKAVEVEFSELLQNEDGKTELVEKVEKLEELWARVFQHEIDHFNGRAIYV